MPKKTPLTPFGKMCRKLRIDTDESIKDFAKRINYSVGMISGFETGSRPVPDYYVERVLQAFDLTELEKDNLRELAKQRFT